ncbi:MAG TPA: protein translocase subunit SecF [candidate division Zixibacteria bacterium]|nr:protein translocase subunit SecF [candidate division Zixibacteria bacterium]
MFSFIQRRRYYFRISAILIAISIGAMVASIIVTGAPFQLGVDFISGNRFEIKLMEAATENEIREVFESYGIGNPRVTSLGDPELHDTWQIRTDFVEPERAQEIVNAISAQVSTVDTTASSVESVSPAVGSEVTRAAVLAISVAAVVILLYIIFSFRQVKHPVRFGASAVIAMLHDLVIIFGFIALMGLLLDWEVDALFLTAALTVAGFSLQDTIVVFDRIRENNQKRPQEDIELTVNRSVLETVHRSLVTQLNAMFVLVALILFGGESIRPFIAVLFVGLLSGTYSSIFTAVPILVAWDKGELPRLRLGGQGSE